MRESLKAVSGKRITVTATFKRFGSKRGWKGRPVQTLLFIDVRDMHDRIICDHIWFTISKAFENLALEPGDMVKCDARSKPYKKGYAGVRDWYDDNLPSEQWDYKLSNPTNVRKVHANMVGTDNDIELELFPTPHTPQPQTKGMFD